MRNRIRLLQCAGILLITLGCGLLIGSRLYGFWAQKQAVLAAEQIALMLPTRTEGIPGEYSNPEMPVLQFEGQDYVCLIDVPAFGVSLPVQNDWTSGQLSKNPCRFWGSCYNETLILGGSSRQGQFDFCSRLDIGDHVVITDMQGAEFTYSVQRIERSKTAGIEQLYHKDYSLTLFVGDSHSGYIIVRC